MGTESHSGQHIENNTRIFGSHNHVINLIGTDGTNTIFTPRVLWNPTPQAGGGLSALLEWRSRLTSCIGREAELKVLEDWAQEDNALSIKIIQAQGGIGKTRLAAEFATELGENKKWLTGFVSLEDFHATQRLTWQGQCLLVVDYPEQSTDHLKRLLSAAIAGLNTSKDKLRILLLCRDTHNLYKLLDDCGMISYLSDQIALATLQSTPEKLLNWQLFTQALQALAKRRTPALKTPATLPTTISKTAFNDWQKQSELHTTALMVLALALHVDDLSSSTAAPTTDQVLLPSSKLLEALIKRETKRWRGVEKQHHLPEDCIMDTVAIATLFNGLDAAQVNQTLASHYGWDTATLKNLHHALNEVWPHTSSPANTYAAMAPDLLAAALLWQWQSASAKQGTLTDASVIATLASQRYADTPLLLERWHMHAYDQTIRLQLGLSSDMSGLAHLLQTACNRYPDFVVQLKHGFFMRTEWSALLELWIFVSQTTIKDSEDPETLVLRAYELNHHATALAQGGKFKEALTFAQKVVDIYKLLASIDPTNHKLSLAMAFNNLANHLSYAGIHKEALDAAQQAVGIYERFDDKTLADFRDNFAMALATMANKLSIMADHPQAVAAGERAVNIYQELTIYNSAIYESKLGISLYNLVNFLTNINEFEKALTRAQESVNIFKKLEKRDTARYEPQLAMSLKNLAIIYYYLGAHEEALTTGKQAAEIEKRLARATSLAYEADYAITLNNLAIYYQANSMPEYALKAASESVEKLRRISYTSSISHEPDLAKSLIYLAMCHSAVREHEQALAAAKEAVEIYTRYAESNLAAFQRYLELSQRTLQRVQTQASNPTA